MCARTDLIRQASLFGRIGSTWSALALNRQYRNRRDPPSTMDSVCAAESLASESVQPPFQLAVQFVVPLVFAHVAYSFHALPSGLAMPSFTTAFT